MGEEFLFGYSQKQAKVWQQDHEPCPIAHYHSSLYLHLQVAFADQLSTNVLTAARPKACKCNVDSCITILVRNKIRLILALYWPQKLEWLNLVQMKHCQSPTGQPF